MTLPKKKSDQLLIFSLNVPSQPTTASAGAVSLRNWAVLSGDIIGDLGGMKVVGCGGLDRPSGLAAGGTLPNPEAHGDSKILFLQDRRCDSSRWKNHGLTNRPLHRKQNGSGMTRGPRCVKSSGDQCYSALLDCLTRVGFMRGRKLGNSQKCKRETSAVRLSACACRCCYCLTHGVSASAPDSARQPVRFPGWKTALRQSGLPGADVIAYERAILSFPDYARSAMPRPRLCSCVCICSQRGRRRSIPRCSVAARRDQPARRLRPDKAGPSKVFIREHSHDLRDENCDWFLRGISFCDFCALLGPNILEIRRRSASGGRAPPCGCGDSARRGSRRPAGTRALQVGRPARATTDKMAGRPGPPKTPGLVGRIRAIANIWKPAAAVIMAPNKATSASRPIKTAAQRIALRGPNPKIFQ